MKKLLSLLGLAGLLTFLAVPIYAQEEMAVEDGYNYEFYNDLDGWTTSSLDTPTSLGIGSISPDMLAVLGGIGILGLIIGYCFFVWGTLLPISQWEIYKKAGKKGRAFLVPFRGTMVYSEIAGMNKWLGLLPWLVTICGFLVGILPTNILSILMIVLGILGLIWLIVASYRIARRYGWNVFASILHAIIIFMPITLLVLGLGNYKYLGKSEGTKETIVEV